MSVRENVNAAIKAAMLAKEREKLQTLRTISAAFKQIEVDKRIDITDEVAISELVRQVKQRQDAAKQYHNAGREDLAQKEEAEIAIIQTFLPQALTEEEVKAAIQVAISESGLPCEMSSMRPLMATLKEKLTGRADMAFVSQHLRSLLQG